MTNYKDAVSLECKLNDGEKISVNFEGFPGLCESFTEFIKHDQRAVFFSDDINSCIAIDFSMCALIQNDGFNIEICEKSIRTI